MQRNIVLMFTMAIFLVAVTVQAGVSPGVLGAVRKIQDNTDVAHWVDQYGVAEYDYWPLVIKESGGDRYHVSSAGARDAVQVMPATRRKMERQKRSELGDSTYRMSNTEAAVRYFWLLTGLFDTYTEQIAAYNCGDARVRHLQRAYGDNWLKHAPLETQRYVRAVMLNRRLLVECGSTIELESAKLDLIEIQSGDGWNRLCERTGSTIFSLRAYNRHAVVFGLKAGDYVAFCADECIIPQLQYVHCEINGRTADCIEHFVQLGDNLYDIGQLYGVTFQVIRQYNGLWSNSIHEGMVLRIPLTPTDGTRWHIVRRGENPFLIARKYGIDVGLLLLDNKLTSKSIISPGQKLTIRAKSKSKKSSPFDSEVSPRIDYRIRRGDTLDRIATRWHTSPDKLCQLNRLNGSQIIAGQTLLIANAELYKIKSGETLGAISVKFGVPTKLLMLDNGIRNTRRVRAGTMLKIRQK